MIKIFLIFNASLELPNVLIISLFFMLPLFLLSIFDNKILTDYPLYDLFNYFDEVTDPSFVPFPNYNGFVISHYLNVNQTLKPAGNNELRNTFVEYRTILTDISPDLSKIFHFDKEVIEQLYDYIFINNENDGVVVEKVMDILNIPINGIEKIQKIMSVFDSKKQISLIFDVLNVNDEYNDFISKKHRIKTQIDAFVLKLQNRNLDSEKVSNNEQFDFLMDAHDFYVSFVNLIKATLINNHKILIDEIAMPMLKSSLLSPFIPNQYSDSRNVKNLIDIIENYKESDNEIKRNFYLNTREILSFILYNDRYNENNNKNTVDIDLDEINDINKVNEKDDESIKELNNPFEKLKTIISDISDPDFTLMNYLINKCGIPESLFEPLIMLGYGLGVNRNIESVTVFVNTIRSPAYQMELMTIISSLCKKSALIEFIVRNYQNIHIRRRF